MNNSELLARLFLALAGRQCVAIEPRDCFEPRRAVYVVRGDLVDRLADDNPKLTEIFNAADTIVAGGKP